MADANDLTPEAQDTAQTSESQKTPRQRSEELLEYLNKDKAINDIFGDAFERQYVIYGKSPKDWSSYFKVIIPETPDTAQCKNIAAKVASLMQEATFFYAAAEAQHDALASGEAREFTTAFNRIVAEYKAAGKSLPASKTLDTIAGNRMIDIRGAIQNAKIIKNFWKRMIEGLTEVRKNLELVTWNNSTQARQEYGSGSNLPTHLPDRGSFGRTQPQDQENDDW